MYLSSTHLKTAWLYDKMYHEKNNFGTNILSRVVLIAY